MRSHFHMGNALMWYEGFRLVLVQKLKCIAFICKQKEFLYQ